MNKKEHLLQCLSEEAGEVAHATSKALRFGLNDKYKDREHTPRQEIINELIDLQAVVEMLQDDGIDLSPPADWRERVEAKKEKVLFMMEIARTNKTLK